MLKLFAHHIHDEPNPWKHAPPWEVEQGFMLALILERIQDMATKEQLDKLRTDVAALITEAVTDITAAVATAQAASPDPAIDQLDKDVTDATQTLKDAAAKLANPTAA